MFKYLFAYLIIFSVCGQVYAGFTPTITSDDLIAKYKNSEKIRVLIVPGHDDESPGTAYSGLREVDLNRALGIQLRDELARDKHFEVIYAHNPSNKAGDGDPGYATFLKNYFDEQASEIDQFRQNAIEKFSRYLEQGKVDTHDDNVPHVTAGSNIIRRLYGINKWVSENNIDLVIHIHYNDHGGRKWSKPGMYSGFAVYVPERQFGNAETSRQVGGAIYNRMTKVTFPSNMPTEASFGGVIEDQDLIAIGAHNTVSVPSVLLEYSYIYEPWVQSSSRDKISAVFARETYRGILSYFQSDSIYSAKHTPLAPYTWKRDFGENIKAKSHTDVFMLQYALRSLGFYPASGKDQNDCPITGVFGPCTKSALKAFQKSYGIKPTAYLGPKTREFLNTIYQN